jgi:hypothetical protein
VLPPSATEDDAGASWWRVVGLIDAKCIDLPLRDSAGLGPVFPLAPRPSGGWRHRHERYLVLDPDGTEHPQPCQAGSTLKVISTSGRSEADTEQYFSWASSSAFLAFSISTVPEILNRTSMVSKAQGGSEF